MMNHSGAGVCGAAGGGTAWTDAREPYEGPPGASTRAYTLERWARGDERKPAPSRGCRASKPATAALTAINP